MPQGARQHYSPVSTSKQEKVMSSREEMEQTGDSTEEDGWRNLRPPLVGLEDDQAAKLLARLPFSELL
jgi:hypothetical protein